MQLGSCVLEEPLGVGGMGAVYLARQQRPHRQVAVKVLRPQLASDPRALRVFLARFRREADATAALDHANIVPIYEFGEDGGMAYLVMPFLKDGSLAALLAREGVLTLPRASAYVDQAAAALDHAHERQLVHRDVKPSNLLLHPDGRLLLADFGIALPIDARPARMRGDGSAADLTIFEDVALTQTGAAMGTPEYMAPEQVQGDPVGPAADIYALGTVAYIMLAGHTPFGGSDVHTVLTRQLIDPPLPLRTTRPDVPAGVEEVIFWALAKEPAERPHTAGGFARALRDAKRGRTLGRLFGWSAVADTGSGVVSGQSGASEHTAVVSTHLPSRTRSLPVGGAVSALPIDEHPVRSVGQRIEALPPTRFDARALSDATLTDIPPPVGPQSPQWPGAGSRPPRRRSGRWVIGIAAALALVLALAAAASLNGFATSLIGGQAFGSPVATGSPHAVLPTATATKPPTPTVPPNWLSVSPTSITLGCRSNNHSQGVRLTNHGPTRLSWSALIPTTVGLDEVSVSPSSGPLDSGKSVIITITNRATFFAYHNAVQFQPHNSDAGADAVVHFTANRCL
jgi:tRNA A-37 threonylcarbamoyl transferase component Bud32